MVMLEESYWLKSTAGILCAWVLKFGSCLGLGPRANPPPRSSA